MSVEVERQEKEMQGEEYFRGEIKMAMPGGENPAGPQGQVSAVSKLVSTGATEAGPVPGPCILSGTAVSMFIQGRCCLQGWLCLGTLHHTILVRQGWKSSLDWLQQRLSCCSYSFFLPSHRLHPQSPC